MNKRRLRGWRWVLAAVCLSLPSTCALAAEAKAETAAEHDARLAWWREARFGMFIHWGLYSVYGGEYDGQRSKTPGEGIAREFKIPRTDYLRRAKDFTCAAFNADEWVQLAQAAGMKYIVFTAKHTEGFAMFRTQVSPFNIVAATPAGRDPLAELADACRRRNMPLGFYYAQSCDIYNGGFGNTWDPRRRTLDQYFDEVAIPQIKELLSNYGEFPNLLWWDAPDGMTAQRANEIAALVRASKPAAIMDDRLGGGYPGDFAAQWWSPRQVQAGDWERHGSMNFGSWGFLKGTSNCSADARTFVGMLVDAASKGGNFILNVTPDAEGRIPPAQISGLACVGQWLKVNGEAIYGTTATPFGAEFGAFDPERKGRDGKPEFKPRANWRCTAAPGKLYIHVLAWPKDQQFALPGLPRKVTRATLLAAPDAQLGCVQNPAGVTLTLPAQAPDPLVTVVRLDLAPGG